MGIRFRCHHCEYELHVKDFQAGKRGRCPACQGRFRVPLRDADYSLEPSPQPTPADKKPADHSALDQNTTAAENDQQKPTVAKPRSNAASSSKRREEPQLGQTAAPVKDQPREQQTAESTPPQNGQAAATGKKSQDEQIASEATAHAVPETALHSLEGSQTDAAHWYVRPPAGGQYGPASTALLEQWIVERRVTSDSLVWRDGWAEWAVAAAVLPQFSQTAPQPVAPLPPLVPPATASSANTSPASEAESTAAAIADSRPNRAPAASEANEMSFETAADQQAHGEVPAQSQLSQTEASALGSETSATNISASSPNKPTLGERNRLERRRRKRRNYIITLSVLTVLALGLIVALVIALLMQD